MAPIKVVKPSARIGTGASANPTVGGVAGSAPNVAPTQTQAATGKGRQPETAPTFNQSPQLAPKPPDNGSTKIVDDQRMPGPRGPRAPIGGDGYGNK
jgi:hypothetical protein